MIASCAFHVEKKQRAGTCPSVKFYVQYSTDRVISVHVTLALGFESPNFYNVDCKNKQVNIVEGLGIIFEIIQNYYTAKECYCVPYFASNVN